MSTHTVEHWTVQAGRLLVCNDVPICNLARINSADPVYVDALAHRIAAALNTAPDMLTALRETIGLLENCSGTRGWNIEADRLAGTVRAAIAKAEGQS